MNETSKIFSVDTYSLEQWCKYLDSEGLNSLLYKIKCIRNVVEKAKENLDSPVESVFTVGKPHLEESVKTSENKGFGDF